MKTTLALETGKVYHIYNRGVDKRKLFTSDIDFKKFLDSFSKHVAPFVDTFAYALMSNHFHILLRVKDLSNDEEYKRLAMENGWTKLPNISSQIGHFCNSYAQYFNNKYDRNGVFFERPFKRKEIYDDDYFTRVIFYIHANPQNHGVVANFEDYPHTSFRTLSSDKETKLAREEVWKWFGSKEDFISFHKIYSEEYFHEDYVIEN